MFILTLIYDFYCLELVFGSCITFQIFHSDPLICSGNIKASLPSTAFPILFSFTLSLLRCPSCFTLPKSPTVVAVFHCFIHCGALFIDSKFFIVYSSALNSSPRGLSPNLNALVSVLLKNWGKKKGIFQTMKQMASKFTYWLENRAERLLEMPYHPSGTAHCQ